MKRYIFLIAAVLLAFAACSQKYEEKYDTLRCDYEFINAAAVADTIPMMVYYSGQWKAEPEEGCDWMSVDTPEGQGVAALHIITVDNVGEARSALLHLIAQQDTLSVNVQQAAGI